MAYLLPTDIFQITISLCKVKGHNLIKLLYNINNQSIIALYEDLGF